MPRVDFLLSNPRHHAAMMLPVAERLAVRPGFSCRVLSLCELRGLDSPPPPGGGRVPVRRVVPFRFRSPSALPSTGAAGEGSRRRRLVRALAWRGLLAPSLARLLARRPDLAVLPNDSAFPYDRIARRLRRRGIGFLLVQEGVRFELPADAAAGDAGTGGGYGSGGARAIAAWGETSAEFFRRQGVPADRIHTTGTPRFDGVGRAERHPGAAGGGPLLVITNPIDDQGYCTTDEKLALVRRFLAGLGPLLDADPGLRVTLKLHARETAEQYRRCLVDLPFADRVEIATSAPLHPLLAGARAAVVMASTVGLEALLFGVPLAVLEIPGHGFAFDYVATGAARGLSWDRPLDQQVGELLALSGGCNGHRDSAERYLAQALATRDDATGRVAGLVAELVHSGPATQGDRDGAG